VSTADSAIKGKAKAEALPTRLMTPSGRSRTPSSSQKPKAMTKRSLQDAFAEDSERDSQAMEYLRKQKHERVIGELELKRRKLENKAMEKQHQREHKHEQHEFRMLQMRIMMSQNQQMALTMMQPQNQASFGGYGLMAELNDPSLMSESPSTSQSPFSM
jgi:hypothetical protein